VPSRRIIFVNRVYWPDESATAQLLTDLAQGLAARGLDIHALVGGRGSRSHQGVTIHHTGGEARTGGLVRRSLTYARFLLRARSLVRRLAAPGDVVVIETDPPLLAAALTGPALHRGATVVQWIQDIYPEIVTAHAGSGLAPFLEPLRSARDRAWRASAACVVVGADMAPLLESRAVSPGRIRHLPNWAPRELAVAPSPEHVATRRADWDITGRFVVAYSGNLGRVHEFETVLDAAERLKAKRGIVFLFAGGGPRAAEVRARAAERRLGNVRFVRSVPREDLPAALAAADVHLVTLRPAFEQLVSPSKLAGVLAAGRPALFVGPPECEAARLLRATGAGLAFVPGDGAGLAEAITGLRDSPPRAAGMAAASRSAYEAGFRFEDLLDRWQTLLTAPAPDGIAIAPGHRSD
jgi:colanic acid biosynthesis glycosyl transferase WcaI